MKFTVSWLRKYIDFDLPNSELAERLTMAGLEVDAVEELYQGLEDLKVAKVVEVNKHPNASGFIFDGFPRTTAQAGALDAFLEGKGQTISAMLALEVPEDELKTRLLGRAATSGRADDADPAVIQKRIDVYNAETAPVADHYRAAGKYQGIDGVGSIEDITKRLTQAIGA